MSSSRYLAFRVAVFNAAIATCMFAAGSEQPACLVFETQLPPGTADVQGKLLNHCSKAVTAYTLTEVIQYGDGTSTTSTGMGEDFLLGSLAAGPDLGPIPGGGERTSAHWTINPKSGGDIVAVKTIVAGIIFDDASTTGDKNSIDVIFSARAEELGEIRFWHDRLAAHKDELSSRGSLAAFINMDDVRRREETMGNKSRPLLISTHAGGLRGSLAIVDAEIAAGRVSQAKAFDVVETVLAAQVRLLEQHSVRSDK